MRSEHNLWLKNTYNLGSCLCIVCLILLLTVLIFIMLQNINLSEHVNPQRGSLITRYLINDHVNAANLSNPEILKFEFKKQR